MDLKKYFSVLFLATLYVGQAHSSNILVVTFFSSKSHKLTYLPLIEELGKRGHNITMLSPVKPMKEMANVKEIFTMDIEKVIHGNNFNPFDMKEKEQTLDISKMATMFNQVCHESYDLPQVRDLLKENFDLVFLQPVFNECILGLLYRLGAPLVLFTPISVPSILVGKLGGYLPPSTTPNFMTGYMSEMTFYQRFVNFGVELMVHAYMRLIIERDAAAIYREKLGDDIPSVSEIEANASLLLSNSHFSLSGPMPFYPDIVDVGGIHSRPAKPIPKDLEDFINKGKDGFILFSMGSAIQGDKMPESKRTMLLNVFSRLKQQVLWKWESESMPDLPKNVKLSKWLPQQDLLGHKDIKMFVTHCGGGSTEESIYHGVPLVGIPMLGDQIQNANRAKKHGFIVELSWNTMTEADLEGAILEVLNNPVYRDNVKRLSTLFKDRPQDPLDLGVYWIEYVLRHKGALHLRNAGRKLNAFQYHSGDVIATYLAIISALLYLIYKTIRFVCVKILCRSQRKHVAVANGKKKN